MVLPFGRKFLIGFYLSCHDKLDESFQFLYNPYKEVFGMQELLCVTYSKGWQSDSKENIYSSFRKENFKDKCFHRSHQFILRIMTFFNIIEISMNWFMKNNFFFQRDYTMMNLSFLLKKQNNYLLFTRKIFLKIVFRIFLEVKTFWLFSLRNCQIFLINRKVFMLI